MDWDTPPSRRNNQEDAAQKVESLDSSKLFRKTLSSKGVVIIMILSLLVLASAYIIRPALIGYSVVKQADESNLSVSELGATVQDLRTELATTKSNLSLYTEIYAQAREEVRSNAAELSNCQSNKESLIVEIEEVKHSSETDLAECRQEKTAASDQFNLQLIEKDNRIAQAQLDLSNLQVNLDEFAFNTARSVCCKAKVDNPSINSYEITNNRLVCLEGGDISLSC
ncbi:MAG TPA: hypothetical protein VJH68_02730 [Candidatus Nanoarchaeia archaeon]|nr:hypothetical protein [Candidatus Nanoarchaeia archaeon]